MKLNILTLACFSIGLNLIGACRNDQASELLAWSCADGVHGSPKATPECYQKLKETSDPVLNHYIASPVFKDGKVEYYTLLEKQRRN